MGLLESGVCPTAPRRNCPDPGVGFLEENELCVSFRRKQQPSALGTRSLLLRDLLLSFAWVSPVRGNQGVQDEQKQHLRCCRPGQVPPNPLGLLGRASSVSYGGWMYRTFYSPGSNNQAETHPPARVGGPPSHPPGLISSQAISFIFGSVNRCGSGFMLASKCDQGLINQSAQPQIAPGSCWETGIPSPSVRGGAGGGFIPRPGASPAQKQPWAPGDTSRLTPLSGKITAAACRLLPNVPLGQTFPSHQGGGYNQTACQCGEWLCKRCCVA